MPRATDHAQEHPAQYQIAVVSHGRPLRAPSGAFGNPHRFSTSVVVAEERVRAREHARALPRPATGTPPGTSNLEYRLVCRRFGPQQSGRTRPET